MALRANSLRNIPVKGSSTFAGASAHAPGETAAVSKTVALDLRPLIVPYRDRGRLTLRIEKLPQSARLSAGQNNGDRTWSLAQDELEGLCYFPPAGFDDEHALAVRIIAKDETGASTIALLDVRVPCASDRKGDAAPQLRLARKPGQTEAPQDGALREEISSLKAALAERDSELSQMRKAAEQAGAQLQEKIDAALWAAECIWKADEAARSNALRAELQEQAAMRVDSERRVQTEAQARREQDAAALRQMQLHVAEAENMLAGRDADLKRLQTQCERMKRDRDADLSTAKAAELHAAAEAERAQRAAQALAEITARCEAAETALASAHAAQAADRREAEHRLETELARLRRDTEEMSAAKIAGELAADERLKAAQDQWQQQTTKALAELAARCEEAERGLAAARAANASDNQEAERARYQAELERLRRDAQEISAAKAAGEVAAAERLKAAQSQWQQQTARALAETMARCEAAEAALASARSARPADNRDADVTQLQAEIKRLQRTADEMSVAKAAGELVAAETLKAAQAQWQQQTAQTLAEITARCQAAEAALASAGAADANAAESDAYIRSLNREIKTLQAALVDREAVLASTQASLEQLRFGADPKSPAAHWRPLPGGNRIRGEDEADAATNNHLFRDVAILFLVAVIAFLAFPRIEAMLPDDVRWQIETVGGLFGATGTETATPAIAAPPPPPKAQHLAIVTRGVNLRAEPSVNGPMVASLKRGAQIAILETRGNWDRVTVTGADQKVQTGWVYSSYVQDDSGAKP